MFNSITEYLEKFKKIEPPERAIKRVATQCVYEELNVNLDPEDISFKQGVIYIKAHPAIKSEVNLNRDNILRAISKKIGFTYNIEDVR